MSAQHTPGPWLLDIPQDTDSSYWSVWSKSGRFICGFERMASEFKAEAEANARRIVQCVNQHDELVQQLRDICALADKNVSTREDGTPHRTAEAQALYDKTVALIAKAGSPT